MKLKKLDFNGFEHVFVLAFVTVAVAIIGTYLIVGSHAASNNIIDVSYPQCRGSRAVSGVGGPVGIVGLNKGHILSRNLCAQKQYINFGQNSLYVNTGYTGQRSYSKSAPCPHNNSICWAYNYGYKAGSYDTAYASSKGLHANVWWLDVEGGHCAAGGNPWTSNGTLNQTFLQGMNDAIQRSGVRTVGYYSTTPQWNCITGNWHPPGGPPTWLALGTPLSDASAASSRCGTGFTGGPIWLLQYVGSFDIDIQCGNAFTSSL